jgi:hypothetical protein
VRKTALQETESQYTEDQHTELEWVLIQAGVSELVAKDLAAKAVANNRHVGYVAQWVEWVKRQPQTPSHSGYIRNQAAYLAGVIGRNADPPALPGATNKLTGWESVISGRKLLLEEEEA